MLLEQNAVPGLTNRLLGPVVRAAAVTFGSTSTFFGSKAIVTGNPVRPEFLESVGAGVSGHGDVGQTRGTAAILVYGGSQGAHAINLAVVAALPDLAVGRSRFRITHQTGDRDADTVRQAYREAGVEADVEPFLYDMGVRLREADVIVCRAGATTLAEIAIAGKAAILIPLPTATDDHQRRNAEAMAAAGAAEVLLQADATGPETARRILALVSDPERRARMGQAARRLARPDAARLVVDRALELAGS
jgi:UDP-N-acetylglucosamine--N-acetylmuramyl-(pentapeptide) pyrophosphoryl-undecaprenol N-acetylglucosamine transferase